MEEHFPSVKVTLVFNGNSVVTMVDRNKTISLLKSQAYVLFNIRTKFHLYYKTKVLTPYLDYLIKDYFKTQRQIHILVKPISSTQSTRNTNSSSLPLLNLNYSVEPLVQNQRGNSKCSVCYVNKINFFCRDCGVFLCQKCRMVKKGNHYSHRTVTLYPENLNRSAMFYKEIVNSELFEAKTSNSQMMENNNSILNNEIDIEQLKAKLMTKFQTLFQLAQKFKEKINSKFDVTDYAQNKEQYLTSVSNALKAFSDFKLNEGGLGLFDSTSKVHELENEHHNEIDIQKKIEMFIRYNNQIESAFKKIFKSFFTALSDGLNQKECNIEHQAIKDYIDNYYKENRSHDKTCSPEKIREIALTKRRREIINNSDKTSPKKGARNEAMEIETRQIIKEAIDPDISSSMSGVKKGNNKSFLDNSVNDKESSKKYNKKKTMSKVSSKKEISKNDAMEIETKQIINEEINQDEITSSNLAELGIRKIPKKKKKKVAYGDEI